VKTNWLIGALIVAVVATALPTVSEAKRLGGGKSSGMQRDMPARSSPDAPPAKPATPAQGQQSNAAPTAGAAPAAAAPKRSWMGPIAGLAAGLGIAALMSHLGMGEAFGNFLMMALLAVAAVFVIGFLLRRFGPNRGATPALAGAGAAAGGGNFGGSMPRNEPPPMQRTSTVEPAALAPVPASSGSAPQAAPEAAGVSRAFVPASFDSEGFSRIAKLIFIRMQAANDSADLDDLRRFTTPELFAEIRLDLQERGPSGQHTDVVKVDADVLDVADEGERQVVSVRFHGQMIEEKGAEPAAFDEIWHLVKPHDDSKPWAIAGIEQHSH